MILFEKMWGRNSTVYQAIIDHPFNQELTNGTLDHKKFRFYIEQDFLFLKDFARSIALIAVKTEASEYIDKFLQLAKNIIIAEQTIITKYLGCSGRDYNSISPACLSYGNFLLRTCALETLEVAISAILPCFLVYQKVGQYAYEHSKPNNPFVQWISTYASEEFTHEVAAITAIFNELAENSTVIIQEKMEEAFYKSSILQYHFWDDAYKLRVYDGFILGN